MVNYGFLETSHVPVYITSDGVVYSGPDVDLIIADGSSLPDEISDGDLPYQVTGTVKGYTETGDDYSLLFYCEDEDVVDPLDTDYLLVSNTGYDDQTVLKKLLDVAKENSDAYPTFRCNWFSLLIDENGKHDLFIMSNEAHYNPLSGRTYRTRISEDLFDFIQSQVETKEAPERGKNNTVYEPIEGTVEYIAEVISAPSQDEYIGLRLTLGEQSDYYELGVDTDTTEFLKLFKNVLHTTETNKPDNQPVPR